MCQDHWDRLRAAIEARGLGHLVGDDGAQAGRRMVSELQEGQSAKNYDPLMASFYAIGSNAMETIRRSGNDPLYLMMGGPEDPVVGFPGYEDRTWPKCSLCYLGLAHEMTCRDPTCDLPRVDGYAWMIDRAADDAAEKAKELGLT